MAKAYYDPHATRSFLEYMEYLVGQRRDIRMRSIETEKIAELKKCITALRVLQRVRLKNVCDGYAKMGVQVEAEQKAEHDRIEAAILGITRKIEQIKNPPKKKG